MDAEGLARLRQLYLQDGAEGSGQQGRASIVYIPAHKSHLDYLMLRCGHRLVKAAEAPVNIAAMLPAELRPSHFGRLCFNLPLACSYVLFGAGLPCPHIAAGANLRLPLVGR